MNKVIQKKWVIWIVLALPALIFFPGPFFKGLTGAKLWGKELKISGFIALGLLVISLFLTPLAKCFPTVVFFKTINRHRRAIGLALFAYICLHFFFFLLKVYLKKGYIPLHYFQRPIVLLGTLAFLFMVPLAVTSNDFLIHKMGKKRWKTLHKLIYLVEILVFFHLVVQGGKPLFWALAFFIPLGIFQYLRIQKAEIN